MTSHATENYATPITLREKVLIRSSNACEAMVEIKTASNEVWARCGLSPIELHHRLTRARGGHLLDDAGEIYHLLALCHGHHMAAHDDDKAFDSGLLLSGLVIGGINGPVYQGPDHYLSRKYPNG